MGERPPEVSEPVVLVAKALLSGTLVVGFSLLGHALRPRWFAGLFGAAPAVAIGGLSIIVLHQGDAMASLAAEGMVFGAVAFVAFALVVRVLEPRLHAALSSVLAMLVWLAVAVGGYEAVLR